MATKKKIKKKQTKKTATPKKKLAKKKATPKKKARVKTKRAAKKRVRGKSETVDTVRYAPEGLAARSGGQSGDLQGLSNLAGANSESVDELLEEGNAFEAEAVKGVQDAGDADEGEVRTHEVPQDDVPGEYRDKDE
jgi:N utilization substance protein A